MKKDQTGRGSTVIRAWTDEDDKKITIQIEDRDGETLAYIQLSPEKASDLSDNLAIHAAKLKIASREKGAPKVTAMGRPGASLLNSALPVRAPTGVRRSPGIFHCPINAVRSCLPARIFEDRSPPEPPSAFALVRLSVIAAARGCPGITSVAPEQSGHLAVGLIY